MGNKVVVPLDGSKLAESILPWATLLARELGASLLLVRVAPSHSTAEYIARGVQKRQTSRGWRDAELYLDQVKRRLEPEGIDVHSRVREGLVADNILDVAEEEGASLIALATHGRRGIARFFLGSVAEGLIHDSRVPLFLVPADASRRGRRQPLRRLLVPLDGSSLSERALEYAGDLAGRRPIVLFRAVSAEDIEADASNTLLVEHEEFTAAERSARDYLEGIAKKLQRAGHRPELMTARGRPAQEIAIAAHAADADLIVMTTHGRTGAERLRLGSIADEVVRHGDLPVLLVSARALAARSASHAGISSIIRRHPLILSTADSVAVAVRKMTSRGVAEAAVVNSDGQLAGMLSQRDLAAWASRYRGDEPPYAEVPRRAEEEAVGRVLHEDTISIEPSTSLADAMGVFIAQRVEAVPVVQGGQLIGVVTLQDVLAALCTAAEAPPAKPVPVGSVPA
jgi:nucleotide-binding universal stress UspA family protein/predicted transcriptional regulator